MAWSVTYHLHPARQFLVLVVPSPTTIRRGVSVFMQCLPLPVYVCTGTMTSCPLPPFPGLSIRAGWAGRMAAFRDCSLARAAVVLCCDRLSRRLRLICVFACLLISARLVKSLSFSLYCFASLLLCSFVSHPSTWWLLLSHNSSLVLHPEASSSAGELLPASVSGWRRAEGLLSLLTLSSPSFGRP